jgi:hypothetical protein
VEEPVHLRIHAHLNAHSCALDEWAGLFCDLPVVCYVYKYECAHVGTYFQTKRATKEQNMANFDIVCDLDMWLDDEVTDYELIDCETIPVSAEIPIPVSADISVPVSAEIPVPVSPKILVPVPVSAECIILPNASIAIPEESLATIPTEEEINDFIHQQRPRNTIYKTVSDLGKLKGFLTSRGDNRQVYDIPPHELNTLLRPFFLTMRKTDGKEFEPSTLDSILRSIDRHLRDNNYPVSIIRDHAFQSTHAVLTAKKKQLVEVHGKGQRPNAATAISFEEEEKLWNAAKLGMDTPQALLHTMWYFNNFFGFRGKDEHHKLKFGDIVAGVDKDGTKYLECAVDRGSKNRPASEVGSANHKKAKKIRPRLWENKQNPSRCPVAAHALYMSKIPPDMQNSGSNFYLTPIPEKHFDPMGATWYKRCNLGVKSLSAIMSHMSDGVLEGRFTNHSGRKTTIQRLKDAKVPDTDIIQLTGHTNTTSLKSYDKVSKNRQMEMSRILCRQTTAAPIVPAHATPAPIVPAHASSTITSFAADIPTVPTSVANTATLSSSLQGIFAGTTITGGVFNFNIVLPACPEPK